MSARVSAAELWSFVRFLTVCNFDRHRPAHCPCCAHVQCWDCGKPLNGNPEPTGSELDALTDAASASWDDANVPRGDHWR